MTFEDSYTQLFMDIGLSKLQSRIYLALLKGDRATGYQIAKQLNEPAANTYKALESLQEKGLILLDESSRVKYYSAQPIGRYLDQVELRLANKREVIEKAVRSIKPSPPQGGIYWIQNPEQLYTQASALIKEGRDIIGLDSTQLPIEQMKKDLKGAAKKKTVLVKSYAKIEIPGCQVTFFKEMGSPVHELPIQYFHLVVPGVGYITALLDRENRKVLQGIYTQNLFLSIVAYNGFLSEFHITQTLNTLFQGGSGKKILEKWRAIDPLRPSRTSAWKEFINSFSEVKTGD